MKGLKDERMKGWIWMKDERMKEWNFEWTMKGWKNESINRWMKGWMTD